LKTARLRRDAQDPRIGRVDRRPGHNRVAGVAPDAVADALGDRDAEA
jgi:hypothetical protein